MLYTGIDLIEISRLKQAVERWGTRFLRRVFTPGELADCGCGTDPPQPNAPQPRPNFASLAARWAAKEATAKALGVGLRGLGGARQPPDCSNLRIAWTDVEVVRTAPGRPLLRLHGRAAQAAAAYGLCELALSLSHTNTHAVASVVGIGQEAA